MRRSPLSENSFPLDLHVLGLPPAFVLSQDQTLRLTSHPRHRSDKNAKGSRQNRNCCISKNAHKCANTQKQQKTIPTGPSALSQHQPSKTINRRPRIPSRSTLSKSNLFSILMLENKTTRFIAPPASGVPPVLWGGLYAPPLTRSSALLSFFLGKKQRLKLGFTSCNFAPLGKFGLGNPRILSI